MFRRRSIRRRRSTKRRAAARPPRFRRRLGRRSFKGRRSGGGLRGNHATVTENFEQLYDLNTGYLQTFSLNSTDWPRAAQSSQQFKYFRLKHMSVTYLAPFNDFQANATLTNPQLPTFYWLRAKEAPNAAAGLDPLQGTTGVLGNLQEVGAVKSVWTRQKRVSYKPNLQSATMISALNTQTSAGSALDPEGTAVADLTTILPTPVWNKWLPTQQPNVAAPSDSLGIPKAWYYGHYFYVDAPAAGLAGSNFIRAIVRCTWEFKEPQLPNIVAP